MIESDDRILRDSVPEYFKHATSPIGAVQGYIAALEDRLLALGVHPLDVDWSKRGSFAAAASPESQPEQPRTFGCHHRFDTTCGNCEALVARWRAEAAAKPASDSPAAAFPLVSAEDQVRIIDYGKECFAAGRASALATPNPAPPASDEELFRLPAGTKLYTAPPLGGDPPTSEYRRDMYDELADALGSDALDSHEGRVALARRSREARLAAREAKADATICHGEACEHLRECDSPPCWKCPGRAI